MVQLFTSSDPGVRKAAEIHVEEEKEQSEDEVPASGFGGSSATESTCLDKSSQERPR